MRLALSRQPRTEALKADGLAQKALHVFVGGAGHARRRAHARRIQQGKGRAAKNVTGFEGKEKQILSAAGGASHWFFV